MNITDTIETEELCGTIIPKDPWSFAKTIENAQERNLSYSLTILFNKGRYFECSPNKVMLQEISELTGLKIQYNTMICGSWKQLEDFVITMNCLNTYVNITIDWI
jgi:hypothetical protein